MVDFQSGKFTDLATRFAVTINFDEITDESISMVRIIAAMDSPLRLLVASIRQTAELKTLAERGLNTFTLLPKIIDDLLVDELTRQAYISFEEAVKKGK